MPEPGAPYVDLTERRTISGVIGTAARLYASAPALFITLGALVLVPYELLIRALGASPWSTTTHVGVGALLLADIVALVIITPLVAAVELHALAAIGAGRRPSLAGVFGESLPGLPVVAAAVIIAGILIVIGFVLLLIPGIILFVRFAVVAQTASFEQAPWPTTLQRSWQLTRGSFLHVLGLLIVVTVIEYVLAAVIVGVVDSTPAVVFTGVAIVVQVLIQSFQALLLGVLYFDLRAREPGA